ncbi:MAG TPA: O-antigen ligase family protein [Polyangia bacterium]|jgi:hypothetical protein
MVYLIALAVCVLPIQSWTDALPKYPGGINFQNLVTVALVIGWIVDCKRRDAPLFPRNPLNTWIAAYVIWTFLALFYGAVFSPVGLPLSMADERFIHWKDEITGMIIFFVAQATLRDERRIKKLLLCMTAMIPYVIGVYYVQYTSDVLERHRRFGVDEVQGDDDLGSRTGVPGARYVQVIGADGFPLKILVDSDHRLRAQNEDGNSVQVEGLSGPATIRIPGWRRGLGPITIWYSIDRRGGGAEAQAFSWELKTITGVFTQIGSNEMAAFYANALLVLLGLVVAWRGATRWRLYLGVNALLLAWGTIFSLSRGAWLAVVAAVAYLGARKNRALLIGFVALMAAAPAFMGGAVGDRAGGGMDASAESRLDFWKWAAVAGTYRYPLGVGYQCYIPKHREETGIKLDTHNFFFRTLAEMGLVGLILVLGMFWKGFRTAWRLVDVAHTPFGRGLGMGVAIMWIGSFVANMFGDRFSYISINCYVWGFASMAAAEMLIAEAEQERLAAAAADEAADADTSQVTLPPSASARR